MSEKSNTSTQRVFRIVSPTNRSGGKSISDRSDGPSSADTKPAQKNKLLRNWKRWVIGIPLSLLLPFIVLVRLSSLFYSHYQLNAWVAVLAGSVIALGLFTGILYIVARRIGLKPGRRSVRTLTVAFASYTVYLLIFVSASNVKAPEIRETYTALHPAIRLALSTFMLLDRDAVVTDSQRQAADYQKMGLNTPNSSLHYTQRNGFVHAVDLRTNGRSETRNLLTAAYFRLMGFSTLRHTGTADHLHVSLQIPSL
ncbi:MAG: hypothetical protein E2O84_08090 [Bacteroidetes bacterium]|nr:MAG: hypothetical protein E2O84_08090 [Bacteroidota bacterium]